MDGPALPGVTFGVAPTHPARSGCFSSPVPSLEGTANRDEDDHGGMSIHPPERLSDDVDLVPMVDCVFLLLVFYMITASFGMQKMLGVPAPDSAKKGGMHVQSTEDTAHNSVVVKIDEFNKISVDDVPLSDSAALIDVLQGKVQREQKTDLVLEADGRALHGTTIAVIDAATEVQIQKIHIAPSKGDERD